MPVPSRRTFLLSAGVGAGAVVAGAATHASAAPAAAHVGKAGASAGTLCYVKDSRTLAILVGDREVEVRDPLIIAAIHAATLEA